MQTQARDVLKLLIPLRVLPRRLVFLGLAFDVTVLLKQLRDDRHADRRAASSKALSDLPQREVCPEDCFAHRVACGVMAQDAPKVLLQSVYGVETTFASAPFLRDLPSGNIGGS